MFHHPNAEWAKLQAESMGVPHITRKTAGEKEKELEDLRAAMLSAKHRFKIEGVVSGALASSYQKQRVDSTCDELGLSSLAPLWHADQLSIIREVSEKFEAIITSVSAEGFDESWLGRRIDSGCISDLERLHRKYGISVAGEGGEYESFVLNAPFFTKRITIRESEKSWEKTSGTFKILRAEM